MNAQLTLAAVGIFIVTTTGCAPAVAARGDALHVAYSVPAGAITRVSSPMMPAENEPSEAVTAPPASSIDAIVAGCVRAKGVKACSITPKEVTEVCSSVSPTRAAHLFVRNEKLALGYLTRNMATWSTAAKVRSTMSNASFDEEVLVLAERRSRGGVIVSGAAVSYEVLRWDGTCATLMGNELTYAKAPLPVRGVRIERLELDAQEALLSDPRIHQASDRADAACKKEGSQKCEVARRQLGAAVVSRGKRLGL